MRVTVNQSRQNRSLAEIYHRGADWDLDILGRTNSRYLLAFNQYDLILGDPARLAVKQATCTNRNDRRSLRAHRCNCYHQ